MGKLKLESAMMEKSIKIPDGGDHIIEPTGNFFTKEIRINNVLK